MSYLPIQNHGVIGNMRTVALVGTDGSIDWLCLPFFDSPSVFGAILDDARGGRFRIAPRERAASSKQLYWPDTNVLITRFLSPDGVCEIVDFMPVSDKSSLYRHELVRNARCVRGRVTLRMECRPAFDYARTPHETVLTSRGAVFRPARGKPLALATSQPLQCDPGRSLTGNDVLGVACDFVLREGESVAFVLRQRDVTDDPCGAHPSPDEGKQLFEETVRFWRSWASRCRYTGRWREMVRRSALALKLLTFSPTGAVVAAPTTSLPEEVGGARNWDYRYTWLRDAAFTLYALLRIGFTEEASQFMEWLSARCREAPEGQPLQIVYGIDGRRDLPEMTLDHLEGYCGSRPVRIGNRAAEQLQLDVYGELMDAVYLFNKYGTPISYELWKQLRRLLDWLCENWTLPDEGIWEVRSGRRPFVYSKLMAWVALDRGVRLAQKRSFPANWRRWTDTRDEVYEAIMTRGWSEPRQAFVQTFDGDALDASNLIMPLVLFVAPNDPHMLKTIQTIDRPPNRGGLVADSLVYRYDVANPADGLGGREGTFTMCSFWLVEALTRAGRSDRAKLEEAELLFERMLGYANDLGLYGEEIGASGEALGNFPQAFTHVALISAAFNLDRALDGR